MAAMDPSTDKSQVETLFRFTLVRPPVDQNPRYPPIELKQNSSFQQSLARAVGDARGGDPREALNKLAALYLASHDFAQPEPDDALNKRLEAIAKVLENVETDGIDHRKVVDQVTTAAGARPEVFGEDMEVAKLSTRLKDSILAMQLLGREEVSGHLETLCRRLRTIETVRKLAIDASFPFDAEDLATWKRTPIVAPTIADYKSILSTAQEYEAWQKSLAENVAKTQRLANTLFGERKRLTDTLNALKGLSPVHRLTRPPGATTMPKLPEELTPLALARQHVSFLTDLTKLTLNNLGPHTAPPLVSRSQERMSATDSRARAEEARTADQAPIIRPFPGLETSAGASAQPLVEMTKTLLDRFDKIRPVVPASSFQPSKDVHLALLPTALTELGQTALEVLKDKKIDVTTQSLRQTVQKIQQHLDENASALDMAYSKFAPPVTKVQRIGDVTIRHAATSVLPWTAAFRAGAGTAPSVVRGDGIFGGGIGNLFDFSPIKHAGNVTVLGMSDLLIVKQQLIGYEKGDIAYIQNVLKGETNTHEVTQSNKVEDTVFMETETTSTKEEEKSTTTRFEMSEEADKTIKEDASVKGGATLSAKYGPSLSLSSTISGSRDRNMTEASKLASKFSQDVTSKASEKLQKRALQRTQTVTTQETIDKETHTFSNASGAQHISGVYQWLNKVYEARVWSYGKRTMLDFMLPEPGAFLLDRATDPALQKSDDIKLIPVFTATPGEISPDDYTKYAVDYGVTDLETPPKAVDNVAGSYASGPQQIHAHADKLEIPDGFEVGGIYATVAGTPDPNFLINVINVNVGSKMHWEWVSGSQPAESSVTGSGEQGEIAFSVQAQGMAQLLVNVDVEVKRTTEALSNWQAKTWGKLKAAYDKLATQQTEQVKQAKFNASLGTAGRNPAANMIIMRNEVKKMCIETMTDQHFDGFGAIDSVPVDAVEEGQPQLHISQANLTSAWWQGPWVRFFEQAFEWDEMTWITYPYFWGRKARWFAKIDYRDDDPEFERFMQAGYARANVPVRLGFEDALDHFLTFGTPWTGGSLGGLSSPPFLPLATEIQESLGKKSVDPEPYPTPTWIVKVPTQLIKLRKDDDVPKWTKKDGQWVEEEDVPRP